MPYFAHLLPTPTTTTTTTTSKPSSPMASSSSAAADASKEPPSSSAPTPSTAAAADASKEPPSSSAPTPSTAAAAAAAAVSPSPSPSPARSPTPFPLPAPPAAAAAAAPPSSASSRRLPPPCWTHEETLALIDSYRDKWYALRRGNLRASHWQEVADAVSRRCSRLPQATSKTSVQCRHKVEKLRKRYRGERQRSLAHDPSAPPSSSWVYFRKMDAMEHGGAPSASYASVVASRPSPSPAPPRSRSDEDDEDDENDDEDDGRGRAAAAAGGNTRSLHRLMANGGGFGGLRFTIPKAVRSKITTGSRAEERAPASSSGGVMNPTPTSRFFKGYGGARPAMEEMRRRLEKSRRRKRDSPDAVGEMVSALRMLGDGFMRMEQMKMEMAREMEKVRMEMELKRTEMILDSQRRIVDAFVKGILGGKKRSKISSEA